MKTTRSKANVNVTLDQERPEHPLAGKQFPCPTCGLGLPIRISHAGKPYLVCLDCGNQLFVRGKVGITRLTNLVESDKLIAETHSGTPSPATLYNRLVQLRLQRSELIDKQGLIVRDRDLKNAIRAVDNEIERVQGELAKLAGERKAR